MRSLQFFVIGIPKGQPRAKACRRGAFTRVYDPGTADEWKMLVRAEAKEKWDGIQFTGPVRVDLVFNFPRPKSHYRGGKHATELKTTAPKYHLSKPDRDNCDKAILDALTNLGLWKDDAIVCSGSITKVYASRPGCNIAIREIVE